MSIPKFTLIALLLAISISGFSQERKLKPIFTPEHEFRLGIGAWPLMYGYVIFLGNDYLEFPHGRYGDQSMAYDRGLFYAGPERIMGSISLAYTYNLKKWVSVGGTFSYAGLYRNYFDRVTVDKKKVGSENVHDFCLTPMVRFTYLNRKYVRLYSQVGLGIGIGVNADNINNHKFSDSKVHVSGQATLFGVAVGNRFFGFAEYGVGTQGLINAGIGYRFINKK